MIMAKVAGQSALSRDIVNFSRGESLPTALPPARLKSFGKGDAEHPGFAFTRYWWEGKGPREGIRPWIHKKLRPGDDPDFGWAAKAEVLLPPTAPSDYMDLEILLTSFDRKLPPYERHVMVQVKLGLDPDEPWHVGYERTRGYARAHLASRFPVIIVAHIPQTVGLEGFGSHVHCIALSRTLNINGFKPANYELCSDIGYEKALAAWRAWIAAEKPE